MSLPSRRDRASSSRASARARRALLSAIALFVLASSVRAACVESVVVFFDDFESGAETPTAWTTQNVTGVVRDYWTGTSLASASVGTVIPLRSDTTDALGNYVLLDVAPVTSVEILASLAGYRSTRNGPIAVTSASSCDVYLMTAADITRQYATLGLTATANRAFVVAELREPDGTPLEGIPLADITLVNEAKTPIGLGPYFFGASGDVVSNFDLSVSTAFDGRARVAFLDVPITTATLAVASAEPNVAGEVTFTPVNDGGNAFVFGGPD